MVNRHLGMIPYLREDDIGNEQWEERLNDRMKERDGEEI